MTDNIRSSVYFGLQIGERLVSLAFPEWAKASRKLSHDFMTKDGKTVNVKASCSLYGANRQWSFHKEIFGSNPIEPNLCLLLAFDNITDLNLINAWMIAFKDCPTYMSPISFEKWRTYEIDLQLFKGPMNMIRREHLRAIDAYQAKGYINPIQS